MIPEIPNYEEPRFFECPLFQFIVALMACIALISTIVHLQKRHARNIEALATPSTDTNYYVIQSPRPVNIVLLTNGLIGWQPVKESK